jgi:hypothetical protein
MLRVVSDREVAKEGARVGALLLGQPRIVPSEGRFGSEQLRDAIVRGAGDLVVIRRAVSCLVERARPGTERLRLPVRDVGPERRPRRTTFGLPIGGRPLGGGRGTISQRTTTSSPGILPKLRRSRVVTR